MLAKWSYMFALVLTVTAVRAEVPEAQEIKFDIADVSITLSNFEIVTGEVEFGTGRPKTPVPLPADKLLPPDTPVWITFDYMTKFKKSEDPKGPASLLVGIDFPRDLPGLPGWRDLPMEALVESGKGAVRLSIPKDAKVLDIDHEFKLYGFLRLNDGQAKRVTCKSGIAVKFQRDGVVELSTTQFTEIQAMLHKVAELEKRVKALEAKKKP